MKTRVSKMLYGVVVVAALGTVSTAYADHPAVPGELGTAVHKGGADRDILVNPGTRTLSVNKNETVRFIVGGKSFMWKFDTLGTPVIDLDRLAPQGALGGQSVRVYVSEEYTG